MSRLIGAAACLTFSLCSVSLFAQESKSSDAKAISEHLKPFAPLLGKTYRGVFKNSTPDKPMIDVSRWERAMNGNAVRILHSLNDGMYGGESILIWDTEKKKLACWYFTTAGFRTEGIVELDGDRKWIITEKVIGASNVSEVRSVSELTPDGKLSIRAEFFENGKWEVKRETVYEESPGSEVKFK
ncbi:MAG: hypothetical protein U0892_06560 [Pirellulales bacterium]